MIILNLGGAPLMHQRVLVHIVTNNKNLARVIIITRVNSYYSSLIITEDTNFEIVHSFIRRFGPAYNNNLTSIHVRNVVHVL
jgi:hypothetical protein